MQEELTYNPFLRVDQQQLVGVFWWGQRPCRCAGIAAEEKGRFLIAAQRQGCLMMIHGWLLCTIRRMLMCADF